MFIARTSFHLQAPHERIDTKSSTEHQREEPMSVGDRRCGDFSSFCAFAEVNHWVLLRFASPFSSAFSSVVILRRRLRGSGGVGRAAALCSSTVAREVAANVRPALAVDI